LPNRPSKSTGQHLPSFATRDKPGVEAKLAAAM
jgi:hypothetical protein